MIAKSSVVAAEWLAAVGSISRAHHVQVDLQGSDPLDCARVRRSAADSGLPWTSQSQPFSRRQNSRRSLSGRYSLIAGFALLLAMAALAGYLIIRAVNRELTVARMQSEFVAAVSHEFRTPLTTLRQFTDMLRDQPSLDAERRRLATRRSLAPPSRLTRLVESMLDFGRMEAGAHRYRFEARDCTALVRRVVDDLLERGAIVGSHGCVSPATARRSIDGDEEALSTARSQSARQCREVLAAGSGRRRGFAASKRRRVHFRAGSRHRHPRRTSKSDLHEVPSR